jgi:hypothetical protein
MLILWIRKRKNGERDRQSKNDKDSFQKHEEAMKRFRFSHPKIEATSPEDIITVDGNVLASVQGIKLTKYIQN